MHFSSFIPSRTSPRAAVSRIDEVFPSHYNIPELHLLLTIRRRVMNRDLTRGPVTKSMLLFAIPMILGDLLQQCYNIADTLIVGQFLGRV